MSSPPPGYCRLYHNNSEDHRMLFRSTTALMLLTALFLLSSPYADAQRRGSMGGRPPATEFNLEFGGFYGFQMIGWAGNYTIKDNPNFGGYASVPVLKDVRVEFSYTRQNSHLEYRYFSAPDEKVFDMSVEYFHLGAVTEMPGPPNRKIIPFGLLSMGMTRFAPQEQAQSGVLQGKYLDDVWRFSIAAGLGTKILISPKFGLRLQARALMPLDFAGAGFWCGTGGCGVGAGGDIRFFQIDASAGAFFVL